MSKITSSAGKGLELGVSWAAASGGSIPPRAVFAGGNVFVARAQHNDEWIPAKLVEGHQAAYVAYGGKEHAESDYEVLVDTSIGCLSGDCFEWVAASGGSVPKRALVAGTDSGKPLYVARGHVNGELAVGKVHPDHGVAYFPWGGEEHSASDYEVLTFTKRHV